MAQEGREEKTSREVSGARGTMETLRAQSKRRRGHEKSRKSKKENRKEETSTLFVAFLLHAVSAQTG